MSKYLKFLTLGFFLSVFTFSLFSSVGCSSSTHSTLKNGYCKSGELPLDVKDTRSYSHKVELKPGEAFGINPNDYAYKGSNIYVEDRVRQIRIHLQDRPDAQGVFKTSVVCVGGEGVQLNMKPFTGSIPLVSDLLIQDENSSQIRTRFFSYDFHWRSDNSIPLQSEVTKFDAQYKNGKPQDVYTDYPTIKQFFLTLPREKGASTDKFQLVSHLSTLATDEKTGKSDTLIVRTAVILAPVTSDERKKLDEGGNL